MCEPSFLGRPNEEEEDEHALYADLVVTSNAYSVQRPCLPALAPCLRPARLQTEDEDANPALQEAKGQGT